MRNRAHDLDSYAFQKGETLLLDANVWLYLYPPPSGKPSAAVARYSAAFRNMISAQVRIMMDAVVLSEYLNSYCRIEWKAQHIRTYPDFKGFRKSTAFRSVGTGAGTFARSILKCCQLCDTPLASANVAGIIADFESGTMDFNDGVIAHGCLKNGWKLVTNDSDLTVGGIEVLTANRTLLQACPG